jgi:type IV pilus assembly protein PilQ
MKIKIFSALAVAIGALGFSALAQTPPATTPPPAPPPASPPGAAAVAPTVASAPSMPSEISSTASAPTNAGDSVVDLVAFDAVPLPDAVRTLALQAGLNIQFDPKLVNVIGPQGQPVPPPNVTEKWHNVTAMQALTALLDNWGWQLVWDPKSKIGRITAKNPNELEPLLETVVQLKYSNPSNILEEVRPTLSQRSQIIPDSRTHQLILMTTEKELPAVQKLIDKLDTATREVLIEARLVETTKDIGSAKGIDWTGTLSAQHISFGNGNTTATYSSGAGSVTQPVSSSTILPGGRTLSSTTSQQVGASTNGNLLTSLIPGNPLTGGGFSLNTAHGITPATAFLNADGVQAVLSFLNTDADTKIVAFPRTVSLDGVPTTLMVVQNIPVFEQTQSAPASGASQGLATVLPNYEKKVGGTILNEVGVKLTVTPRIAGPTNVLLDVKPEISQKDTLVATETLNGQVNTAPIFDRRRIETEASVPSGFTLVLGGLDEDTVTKSYTKVPALGDIPGLGYLFRSDSKNHERDSILVFVTPTIITDGDFQPAETGFLARKPTTMTPMNEKAWDTGEPIDWTKPHTEVTPVYEP